MRHPWNIAAVAVAFSIAAPQCRSFETGSVGPAARENAVICGPAAVRRVLSMYGRECDLIELVREMQWPDLESGATIADLRAALEARGIATVGLRVVPGQPFHWRFPVIIHLGGSQLNELGHYVVCRPSSRAPIVQCWDAAGGAQTMTWEELRPRMSGVVVLTAPQPITAADLDSLPTDSLLSNGGVLLAMLLSALLVVVAVGRGRARSVDSATA